MSASREKKVRQERVVNGYVDSKAVRAAEEKAKQRKSNLLYGTVAALFVVVAVFVVVWNSATLQGKKTALTLDDTKYTAAQMQYLYHAALNNVRGSQYASYLGLDNSKSLSQQTMNDTAKMLLGVTEEGDLTWDAYCLDMAKKAAQANQSMLAAAASENCSWTDELQAQMDDSIQSVKDYAKANKFTYKEYIKAVYGNLVTVDVFESMLKDGLLITSFEKEYQDSLTYTDDEIDTYYQDNAASFQVANYEYVKFNGAVSPKKDADGNAVDATEEEIAAAKDAAKTAADEALARYKNGETLEAIAGDYDIGTYSAQAEGAYTSDFVSTWVFDEARQAGDCAVVDDGTNYYTVLFHSVGRQDYNTVNVRHILFRVDSSSLDSSSETYQEDLAKLQSDAKANAEETLQAWKADGSSEDMFAKLADEKSDDAAEGGLYQQVYHNQMVQGFNDWCFATERKAGDCEIVESTYGYHIIYFVGQDLPYWQVRVTNALRNTDYNNWLTSLQQEYTVTEGAGMKYVG